MLPYYPFAYNIHAFMSLYFIITDFALKVGKLLFWTPENKLSFYFCISFPNIQKFQILIFLIAFVNIFQNHKRTYDENTSSKTYWQILCLDISIYLLLQLQSYILSTMGKQTHGEKFFKKNHISDVCSSFIVKVFLISLQSDFI